jgi:hypothetical protein
MNGLNKEFNEWWDSDELVENNPFNTDTAMFWAWEGWQAGVKREREACAKVCETEGERVDASWVSCAAAIRARGQE